MNRSIAVFAAITTLGLGACSKTDTAPTPEHSAVAASMPDAASTPGATGPATIAPHATPPQTSTSLTPPGAATTQGQPR
jgi:hypothetical protein